MKPNSKPKGIAWAELTPEQLAMPVAALAKMLNVSRAAVYHAKAGLARRDGAAAKIGRPRKEEA